MRELSELADLVAATGQRQELYAPADGHRTACIATSTPADVAKAASCARAAQPAWAASPIEQRAELLLAFHDRILTEREWFADVIQLESGKSRLSAMEEVLHVALTARYYGLAARRYLRDERGHGIIPLATRIDRRYVAKGLVGVIGPWNYPLSMSIADGLAALVAGNAILLKPDTQTPLVAVAAVNLLVECGLPAELWQVVNGRGAEIGPALIDEVDYLCFTGSVATARVVAVRCAERLIGCSLELGGKNPLLVLDDADLGRSWSGILRACFASAGQLCVSAERIYVAESRMAEFCEAFVGRVRRLRLGSSADVATDVGCLISLAQLQRTSDHVTDARVKGATVLTGGCARPDLGPLFYEPTVLTGVTAEMDCYAEETFGPVVSIYPVADDADAIRLANDSPYGLNGSVWTADPVRGRQVAARLRCGTVNINDGYGATFGSIDAPMGGMKQSGLGRRQGRDGLRRFVDVQSIATQAVPLTPPPGVSNDLFVAAMVSLSRALKHLGRP